MAAINLESQNPQLAINDLLYSSTKGFNASQWNRLLELIMALQKDVSRFALQGLFRSQMSLTPVISCTYINLVGTNGTLSITVPSGAFTPTEIITDSKGNTAVVVSETGGVLTLSTIVMTSSWTVFNGTITGGTSGHTATVGTTTYTSGIVHFQIGETVTDNAGNSGVIVTDDGMGTMTLTTLTAVAPPVPATFVGVIIGGTSSAQALVNIFNWGDQIIDMTSVGGTGNFIEVTYDILGIASTSALDTELWSGIGRTGTQYMCSNNGSTDALSLFTSVTQYANNGFFLLPNLNGLPIQIPNILYMTLGTISITPNQTCLLEIRGVVN